MNGINTDSQFREGFMAGVATLILVVGIAKGAMWLYENGAAGVVAWLTAQQFTALDLVGAFFVPILLWTVLWVAAYGPRRI